MKNEKIIQDNAAFIETTWQKLNKKILAEAVRNRGKIPYTAVDGVYDDKLSIPENWTNGFWGGLMWLMYGETKNEEFALTAKSAETLMDKAFKRVDLLNHDVGFMWHVTSGAAYRLTGDKESFNRNLLAAMILASRYNIKGEFLRCWNGFAYGGDTSGWTIIDSLMNLPLLYWASKETGDDRFKRIATAQADMCARDHVRADGTINHIVSHDVNKANTVLNTFGGQGYKQGSCWSRGQSWAVYGFALSYIHTGGKKYLDAAKKTADVFIRETEKTAWLPRCDFSQPEFPEKYDSTAGAIASCGFIEIARATGGKEREKYLSAALNVLTAMEKNWCDWNEKSDSVLQYGIEAYSVKNHRNIIYGDFFFTEAILKLKGSDFLIW